METKHTPGPWKIGLNPGPMVYTPDGTSQIADARGVAVTKDESKANARLIAAAPELLEACRNLSQYVAKGIADGAFKDCALPKGAEKRLNQALAAIAKAT